MDELQKLLDRVDRQVKAKLEKILAKLTPKQRAALIQNPKLIDDLIKEINVEAIAKQYSVEFMSIAGLVVKDYSKIIDAVQKKRVAIFIETLRDLKTEALRDFIIANKQQFKSKLVEMIIGGSNDKTIKEYFAKTPFTTAQVGTLINTAESDIRRATVMSAFEDKPEQKFEYVGGLIPTSSETCTWLYENQNPEGYTMDEIQAGIVTPYGIVDWNGRIPNYNCIHSWEPIL